LPNSATHQFGESSDKVTSSRSRGSLLSYRKAISCFSFASAGIIVLRYVSTPPIFLFVTLAMAIRTVTDLLRHNQPWQDRSDRPRKAAMIFDSLNRSS